MKHLNEIIRFDDFNLRRHSLQQPAYALSKERMIISEYDAIAPQKSLQIFDYSVK
ncbi:hypothetical protein ACHMW4_14325 [Mesorhizobium sp. UC22_110]|uniref:hypothetical protein n=1 Tax=unclassified Mesorhizobium TaxID=325217 RepID=UPI00367212DC